MSKTHALKRNGNGHHNGHSKTNGNGHRSPLPLPIAEIGDQKKYDAAMREWASFRNEIIRKSVRGGISLEVAQKTADSCMRAIATVASHQ